MDIKNVLKTNLIIFIQILCSVVYSQNNESETDSVFRVDPSSMNKNNYYLRYQNPREGHDEFNSEINSNLIWKKNNLNILWVIKSISLETIEDIKWESINWIEVNSKPETFFCETINNVPNGKWNYSSLNETVSGHFLNGLANGSWDRTENHPNGKIHIHQEFLNGMPHGEWFEEVDGIKWYNHSFLNGKPNGLWIDNLDINKKRETEYKNGVKNGICKTSKNDKIEQLYYYKDGIIDGNYFEYKENILVKKGSYNMGVPNKIWEIYKIDKTSKARYLVLKYDFSNSTQIIISESYSNGKPKKMQVYEYKSNIIIGGSSRSIIDCNQNEGGCDSKTTTYFNNGNIEKIVFSGSESYLNNKKFISNYENGKIKYEGTYGGNIIFYDSTGKIVQQTIFSMEPFRDVNAN